uniref:PrgI family protein n=1 Tax=Strongyloides stercoralis TaxID=6248 RepID=A0A0K0EHB0_STRER
MSGKKEDDNENPSVTRGNLLGAVPVDPVFPIALTSMVINTILGGIFLYGCTGNVRLSALSSLIIIPVSLTSCLTDAEKDFKKWHELEESRKKGTPECLLPYRCKYNWTGYEDSMKFVIKKVQNNKE